MKLFYRALVAITLLTGSFALAAQGHDRGRGHDSHHVSNRGHNNHQNSHRKHQSRHNDHRAPAHSRYRADRHHRDRRHYGRSHRVTHRYPAPRYVVRHNRWARGHRYHGPNYVVSNYGYYRLRPPPRGYHWVRANNDYLLVAIATGVILDIALH